MSEILKRNREESSADLIVALGQFCELLDTEGEDDAVKALNVIAQMLESAKLGSKEQISAAEAILDCFDGDLELNVYTLHKRTDQWTKADQLANISARVLSLAKRILHSQQK